MKVAPRPGALSTRDVAAALLHDAVDGGEAEPGALPRLLGGEERLEDAGLVGHVHADAGVASPPARRRTPARTPFGRPVDVGRCSSRFEVVIVTRPPCGIASRAFTTRFTSTCSSWPGSASTYQSPGSQLDVEHDVGAEQPAQHAVGLRHRWR